MNIDWSALRTLNGSQHKAFEELCCQLAGQEAHPEGSSFRRLGTPDAGVECYWTLPDGSELGWQAKFFTGALKQPQWRQIDQSVTTALTKHPRLSSYTICLPLDLPDAGSDQKQSGMQEWKSRVAKWQQEAKKQSRSVEFKFWGQSEILQRLAEEKHRGRYYFWFRKELFSTQWFGNQVDVSVENAGARYTSRPSVDLPLTRVFGGLGRTDAFCRRAKAYGSRLGKLYSNVPTQVLERVAAASLDSVRTRVTRLVDWRWPNPGDVSDIDLDLLAKMARQARDAVSTLLNELDAMRRPPQVQTGDRPQTLPERFTAEQHSLRELLAELYELEVWTAESEAQAAQVAAVLVTGAAGTGKTHLLCDTARQRIAEGKPTILLLGEHFDGGEPWAQIIRLLGLVCDRQEFLGALSAAGEDARNRTLILIDALNEGEGRSMWQTQLAGMLRTLASYRWLGVAVTVRTSYESTVIPDWIASGQLARVEHRGFAGHEDEAAKLYFDHYGIERPSVPLLLPEFQNPLFLKLLCQGLRNKGLKRLPASRTMTSVFGTLIESTNAKLARSCKPDFDPKSDTVQQAVDALARAMAHCGKSWLPRAEARRLVDAVHRPNSFEGSLFRGLIHEGILDEDMFAVGAHPRGRAEPQEGIRFSYERLSDHLIAQHLLSQNLHREHPSQAFLPAEPLGRLVASEQACFRNQGILEALSIQLAETSGLELGAAAPACAEFRSVREAFVDSLIWRDVASITETTLEYARAHVLRYADTHRRFVEALFTVALRPDHPYNADFLHKRLMQDTLAERDCWWSTLLHWQYEAEDSTPVKRLVEWLRKPENADHVDDNVASLAATILAWFLTSSNRFLRDNSTKALVALLDGRIGLLRQLLARFAEVDDPYVSERLTAVAYGCAMRTTDFEGLRDLAQEVYDRTFAAGDPPPDILLRDYARGVVERAWHLGLPVDVEPEKLVPPHKSAWPADIADEAALRPLGKYREGMSEAELAALSLYGSIMGGDFARYVVGSDPTSFEWSSRRLDEPAIPSRKDRYDRFVRSLTPLEAEEFERFQSARSASMPSLAVVLAPSNPEPTASGAQLNLDEALRRLRESLGIEKSLVLEQDVLPFLDNPYAPEFEFDRSFLQRWILKRVYDLGWTAAGFGDFDRRIQSLDRGRGGRKPERIGKKYQWIAYHEILARVSDNFRDQPEFYDPVCAWIRGVERARDIDPSSLLNGANGGWNRNGADSWWSPKGLVEWRLSLRDDEWLSDERGLPKPEKLMELEDPASGRKWLTLHGSHLWKEHIPDAEEPLGPGGREVWVRLDSCLCKSKDVGRVVMPRGSRAGDSYPWSPLALHGSFLGEFHWSQVYRSRYDMLVADALRFEREKRPSPALFPTTEGYAWDSSYDCSVDPAVTLCVPSRWLADQMGLSWNAGKGGYSDHTGELIAFDPSARQPGRPMFLVEKEAMLQFLKEHDLVLIWALRGEKNQYDRSRLPMVFEGRLEIDGTYHPSPDGTIVGKMVSSFRAPEEPGTAETR